MFDDLIDANADYVTTFTLGNLRPTAARTFALVTCIDSRIEPLAMLGLVPGDAKIFRNAGGRVTSDTLRSLAMATAALNVKRIAVMHHTGCAMVASNDELARKVHDATGADTHGWDFHGITDPDGDLVADVEAIRTCPLIAPTVEVAGWRYDTTTGRISVVIE